MSTFSFAASIIARLTACLRGSHVFCRSTFHRPSGRTGPTPAKSSRPAQAFIRAVSLALALSLAVPAPLLLKTALAAEADGRDAEQQTSVREIQRRIDPSSWNLSPEAEHLYYYLLLSEGLSENNEVVIASALQGLLKLDPSLPVFQDSATIFLSRGEYSGAEQLALKGLEHFPDDAMLTLLLAGAYSENGQTEKAVAGLEAYLTKHPKSIDVLIELARLYLQTKQDKKATDLLSRLPEKEQTPATVLFRARVLATTGRMAEARVHLRRLLKKEPDFFEGWLELGIFAEREHDTAEALDAYIKAAELDSDNAELWSRIAGMQIELGHPHEALLTLEKAPPSSTLFLQAALRFANYGHFREAESILKKADEHGASPDETAVFLSEIKAEASDDPLAGIAPLESIPSTSPMYPNALRRKAQLHIAAGQYEKALEFASMARKLAPERKESWGVEAYALIKGGKADEAEALLKDALAKYPEDPELMFSLGGIQDEAGKKELALQTMEALIKKEPKHAQALNYVGYTLAENNTDLERALALITAALEEKPDAAYIVDSLAWAQYRLGRHAEAWKTINQCLALGGDEAAIWEHYAEIAMALGKKHDAVKGYTEALKRDPSNADELRKRLAAAQKK